MNFIEESLTSNGVATIMSLQSASADRDFQPVLQVLAIKNVGNDRFRIVLSDGSHYAQGMLATQLKHLVESGKLMRNTLIKIQDFLNNSIQGRNIIFILRIEVLGIADRQLGQPTDLEMGGVAPPRPTVTTAPMYNRTNTAQPITSNAKVSPSKSNPYSGSPHDAHRSPENVRNIPPLEVRGPPVQQELPPAQPRPHRDYYSFYNDMTSDPFAGDFFNYYNKYAVGNTTPADLCNAVYSSGNAGTPMHCLLHVRNPAGSNDDPGLIIGYHRLTRRFGQQPTPFDNQGHAFIGDVIEGQAPVTVRLEDFLFNPLPAMQVPTPARLDQVLLADPEAQVFGPFQPGDPGVVTVNTRSLIIVPNRYVLPFLREGCTPRRANQILHTLIRNDGNTIACAPLLDWLRATLVRRGVDQAPSTCVDPPRTPTFLQHAVQQSFVMYRLAHVHQDLPALQPGLLHHSTPSLAGEVSDRLAQPQHLAHEKAAAHRQPKQSHARQSQTSDHMANEVIYILECDRGKYYVGKTRADRVDERFQEHVSGHGSAWTIKHKPHRIVRVVPCTDPLQEDIELKKCMRDHGIDNVRGGVYSTLELSEEVEYQLRMELKHADGRCFRCGQTGHFSGACRVNKCDRCGRTGHLVTSCTDVTGNSLFKDSTSEAEPWSGVMNDLAFGVGSMVGTWIVSRLFFKKC